LATELAKEKEAAEFGIKELSAKWIIIKSEIGNAEVVLQDREKIEKAATKQRELEASMATLQASIDEMSGELPGYQVRVHELEAKIATLKQGVADLGKDEELARLNEEGKEAERQAAGLEKEAAALDKDPELVRLKQVLAHTEADTKVGDGIDATCQSVTCAAIKSVNEAKEQIPDAKKEALKRTGEVADLMDAMAESLNLLSAKALSLQEAKSDREKVICSQRFGIENRLKATTHDLHNAQQAAQAAVNLFAIQKRDIAKLRDEIAQQKALADRLPEIQIAEARKADLEKQLQEVTEQGTQRRVAWTAKESAVDMDILGLRDKLQDIFIDDQAQDTLSELQHEIKEIETVRIPEIEKEIQTARDKITTLQNELAKIEQAEKELEQVRAEREALTKKISTWRYLQNECGEKGLQAHEISGAAPSIVKNANDLLMSAFDIPYTMRLKTFDEEDQKECFKVLIICPDGQEVDLDLISGGQRAWCVQALWLAMSLLKQQNSGQEFDYFCADESDGALDPDNAAKYAALYPSFMKLAKLKSLYFISHQPPARALADHVLQFKAGEGPRWG